MIDRLATDRAALTETVSFLSHFNDLRNPRQQGKMSYSLTEILLLCVLAVLAGAETATDIAVFGAKKLDLLRRFGRFRYRHTDPRSPGRSPGRARRRAAPTLFAV